MTIKNAQFFWPVCSGCEAKIDSDYGLALHETAWEATDEARDVGWHVHPEQGSIIYCDACKPSWCLECERDITPENPRCGDDVWSCASCHSGCDHEEGQDQ